MTDLKIIPLHQWEVHEFNWGSAIKNVNTQKWESIFLKPNAQEIDVSKINIIIHDNGIEFIDEESF